MFDVVMAKPKLVLHIVGGTNFIVESLVRRSRGVMFAITNYSIVHILVMTRISQYLLAKLGGNLAMCQWEGQSISNTNVVCAIPCSAKLKDSSMHAFLTLVFGQGIE